ncbi:MBL fold metallo-hydrolase [Bacteroidetes/Chlorobi group bacterium MS-B_bin-24]|jgi:glyoxylase-like metal-dependent hydrolase (beta-lactamase superfamily II)|nr:MAG: MBL fold metallo-hydrolase [Bacteroidetes/Chlorobi group bacterium MS-B_bin-24]
MRIIPVVAGLLETNCYLVVNPQSQTSLLIDAPPESSEILFEILSNENSQLEAILLTHTHWDHCADLSTIKERTSAPVYVHILDSYRLENPMEHTIIPLDFNIEPCKPDYLIKDEETLKFKTADVRVLHTPGHTEGSVVYVVDSLKAAFAGDTIFYLSVGRTDLPGGDANQLQESLFRLLNELPDDYRLFVGHYQETTVGFEKSFNPFLVSI